MSIRKLEKTIIKIGCAGILLTVLGAAGIYAGSGKNNHYIFYSGVGLTVGGMMVGAVIPERLIEKKRKEIISSAENYCNKNLADKN